MFYKGKTVLDLEKLDKAIGLGLQPDNETELVKKGYFSIVEGKISSDVLDREISDELLEKIAGSLDWLFHDRFANGSAVTLMQLVDEAGRVKNRRSMFLARFFSLPEAALKEVI